ncbi:hypothetical protein GCM10009790_27750 [Georgenia ruanii]
MIGDLARRDVAGADGGREVAGGELVDLRHAPRLTRAGRGRWDDGGRAGTTERAPQPEGQGYGQGQGRSPAPPLRLRGPLGRTEPGRAAPAGVRSRRRDEDMGIGDKAKDLGEKAKDFLNTDKGEEKSDDALQRGTDALNERTGGKYEEQLEKGQTAADQHIGDE